MIELCRNFRQNLSHYFKLKCCRKNVLVRTTNYCIIEDFNNVIFLFQLLQRSDDRSELIDGSSTTYGSRDEDDDLILWHHQFLWRHCSFHHTYLVFSCILSWFFLCTFMHPAHNNFCVRVVIFTGRISVKLDVKLYSIFDPVFFYLFISLVNCDQNCDL